ncbi:MAG: PH domain-containing protein [Clostridium sp.]|uniref:PH domain-containing protein n=1 Tax=Clostridium sp. TaxID=1506 RepID=UPI003F3B68AD
MDKPFRSHISIILRSSFGFLGFIFIFLFNFVSNYFNDIDFNSIDSINTLITDNIKTGFLIILGFLLIISIRIFINFLLWRKTYMYLDNTDFVYERSTFFKSKRTFPLKNIASVNINQNIFQRIIGTGSLKFDLNSSLLSNTNNVHIVLKKNVCLELEHLILTKISEIKGENIDEIKEKDDISYNSIVDFSLFDVIKHSIFNLPTYSIFFTLCIVLPFIFEIFDRSSNESFFSLIPFIILVIIFQGCSIILKVLKYYNFKVNRNSDIIYLSYGLFNKKNYSFSINKVNAIIIKRSLLCKLFNMYSLQGMVAGLSDEQSESPCLSLCVKKDELDMILAKILPEFKNEGNLVRAPKNSFYIRLVYFILVLIPSIVLMFINNYAFILIPVLILFLLYCYFVFKFNTVIIGDSLFTFSKGAFDTSVTTIPYKNIQLVSIKSSPLKNLFKFKTGSFSCISDSFNFVQHIGSFEECIFNSLTDKLF